jgi:hypothetical protein
MAKGSGTQSGDSVKYWEIIADNLSKAGWSWGCVATRVYLCAGAVPKGVLCFALVEHGPCFRPPNY